MLVEDLKAVGLRDIYYNESNGFVLATLPANTEAETPSIGFIAHMEIGRAHV